MLIQYSRKLQEKAHQSRQETGAITVFLALVLILIISVSLSLLQSAYIQASKSAARLISYAGIDSLFGEYNEELLLNWNVFGLDTAPDSGGGPEERLENRYLDYLSYHIDMEKGLDKGHRNPVRYLWDGNEAEITTLMLMTDEEGAPFRNQLSDFMQEKYGIKFAEQLLDLEIQAGQLDEQKTTVTEREESNKDTINSLKNQLEEAGEESGEEADFSEIENTTADVEKIKAMSVLNVVLEDPEAVSNKKIQTDDLVSNRELLKGYGECPQSGDRNEALDKVLFSEYLMSHYTNYRAAPEDDIPRGLDYEIEYILAGEDSDIANLENVTSRLLLIREGANFAYLCTDSARLSEAEALAVATAGLFGVPALVTALKWAFVLAWAYIESILDVRTLLAGGKVPIIKESGDWESGLSEIVDFSTGSFRIRSQSDKGADYETYLRIMMYLQGIRGETMRALDLCETSIKVGGDPDFRIDQVVVGAVIRNNWSISGKYSYEFSVSYRY